MDRIYLTGFMGAGKSTVGALLAQKLGWEFCDLDSALVSRHGVSIEEIFQTQGESFFRDAESELLQEVSQKSRLVIALGGGALLRPENQDRVFRSGTSVFLKAQVSTLLDRLLKEKNGLERRPLFRGLSDLESLTARINDLLQVRNLTYERAHLVLHTDQKSVSQVVEELTRRLA